MSTGILDYKSFGALGLEHMSTGILQELRGFRFRTHEYRNITIFRFRTHEYRNITRASGL